MAYPFVFRISLLLYVFNGCMSDTFTNVKTEMGTIFGTTASVKFQQNTYEVDRYLGIPYAKPPVGELRFKKPVPYGVFNEPFSATKFGPVCPQFEMLHMGIGEQSEDCLSLNIYVPKQKSDKDSGHAVMLFIHGGGFTMGTGATYQCEVLSSVGNVIVVTINYRLGLLGFLDTEDKNSAGNFGLWDQHLALQWVNKNIGAFGGDNERVTIFGESAGAVSVALQMIYPPNKGLFRSGITQSGALTMPGIYKESNIEIAKYYAENISCSANNTDEVFTCLQKATWEDIIKVVADAMSSGDLTTAMKVGAPPTVDGEFIKEPLAKLFERAETEDCPEINFFRSLKLMNGINGQEGALFLFMLGQPGGLDDIEITREQMNTQQVPGATALVYGFEEIPDVLKQIIISDYTDWGNPDDPKTIREQLVRLFGDIYFNVPGVEMSRVHCNSSEVVSYLYNFIASVDKHLVPTPSWIKKANHGDEMGAVFGYNYDFETLLNASNYLPPEWELKLSRRMMTYWSNFAKTGDPNQPPSDTTSSVTWPKYDLTSQAYMKFDKEDSTGQYLFARETEFWRNILPSVLDATKHAQTITSQYGGKDHDTCEQGGDC